MIRKSVNFLLSLTVASGLILSVGCGEKKDNGKTVTEDEMPYGATIQINKTDYPIAIEFDNRFVTEAEAEAIANYFYAVQTHDAELVQKASYPPYITSLATAGGFASIEEFITSLDNAIASDYLQADDYTYSYISVTSCTTEEDAEVYTYFNQLDQSLVTAESECSSSKDIISAIESRKLLSLEIICEIDGNERVLTNITGEQQVYVYTIDGTAYVL